MAEEQAQEAQQEPIIVVDDVEYKLSDMSQECQYIVQQLNALRVKQANAQFDLDQLKVASDGFSKMLSAKLKESSDDVPEVEMRSLPQ